jgi:hypothetical protein
MEIFQSFWTTLPKMPVSWVPYFWMVGFVAIIPSVLHGQRLGKKAVDEGRARLWFGMVSNPTVWTELRREVNAGNKVALYAIRLRYIVVVLALIVFVWPKHSA